MNKVQLQLLEIVKCGLWEGYCPDVLLFENCEWEEVYRLARVQATTAIAFDGLEKLYTLSGKTISIPKDMLMTWLMDTKNVEKKYRQHCKVIGELCRHLTEVGIKHYFMKGLVCGARYPKPEHRSCGDIDFVVSDKDFDCTMNSLEKIAKVKHDLAHEHHGLAHMEGVLLEPHYKVHNYQYPANDKTMQRLFNQLLEEKPYVVNIEGTDIPTFPPEFEGMFLISHMVNHVYEEGLGLRQVLDYAVYLRRIAQMPSFDKIKHEQYLKEMNMVRAHRIFTRICEEYLNTDISLFGYKYSYKDMAFSEKMAEDIMQVGNFARGKYIFRHETKMDELRNYIWVARRAFRLGYLCPTEAYMWPFSKFIRYFDKIIRPNAYGKKL